jgi:Spy/CpxP family protein refolding chaperone
MKSSRLILVAALFLAPLVARAQSNPNTPAPDSGVAPPEPVIAQQTPSAARPAPRKPMTNVEVQVVGGPEGEDPVIAQQSQSEATPPPGKTTVNTEVRVIREPRTPGAIEGYEPRWEPEFGPGLGAWWKNSEVVSKLQLSDEQVKKISKTFLDHKLQLIDLQADLDKQELRLQPLLDDDQPDESKVGAQIDLITAAHGKLEKENAMMMLDIRRRLSVDQWKKLKALKAAEERDRNVFYYRSGPGGNMEGPPARPLPGDMPVIVRH